MVEVVWTEDAAADMENIISYISNDSVKNALICFEKIIGRVEILNTQPYAGHITPEFMNPEIREVDQFSYRIIYKIVNDNLVHILTIHHSKMLLSNNPHFDFL